MKIAEVLRRHADAWLAGDVATVVASDHDDLRRVQGMFAGTAEDCTAWLADFARAGVRHFVLRSPALADQIDRLAREVVPRLRAACPRRDP